jgi:hypothetical protein
MRRRYGNQHKTGKRKTDSRINGTFPINKSGFHTNCYVDS